MAWVQIGSRKVNTALICFMEQDEEKLKLFFQGQANALELQPDEARVLWKYIKSEDLLGVKDKGSTMVLPKRWSAAPGDVMPVAGTPAKPLQVAVGQAAAAAAAPAPAAAQPAASSQPKPSSHGHSSSSHSSSHRPSSSHSSSSHRSSSHGGSSSSHSSSSSKQPDGARVLEFKKD